MRPVILGTLMAAAITTATAAEEDTNSANYMLPYCKRFMTENNFPSNAEALREGVCAGRIDAIAFMAANSDVAVTALSGEGRRIWSNRKWRCADIPFGVTTAQEILVVIRYIETRPNRMHEPFNSLALEALLDAWPCK